MHLTQFLIVRRASSPVRPTFVIRCSFAGTGTFNSGRYYGLAALKCPIHLPLKCRQAVRGSRVIITGSLWRKKRRVRDEEIVHDKRSIELGDFGSACIGRPKPRRTDEGSLLQVCECAVKQILSPGTPIITALERRPNPRGRLCTPVRARPAIHIAQWLPRNATSSPGTRTITA